MSRIGDSIPKGMYCYEICGKTERGLDVTVCPHWSQIPDKPKGMNGYCEYLKTGDWEENASGLLWDFCKECG